MKNKHILSIAALFGFLGVILGALGAHALESKIDAEQLESYRTAVRYQLWHALALLVLPSLEKHIAKTSVVAWLWSIGVVLFSGSIYFLSLRGLIDAPLGWLGPVTPLGGLFLISGWLILLISALRSK